VEPHARPVDPLWFVPNRITRDPLRLWEPGDTTGTAAATLTWVDDPSSTIHNPYYYLWLLSTKRRQRK
jgi:hypothetical protein